MAVSGKYNFQGIKKLGAAGIRSAFSASPYTAWLNRLPKLTDFVLEFFTNWLANHGLILLNTGAYFVDGKLDQRALDRAIEAGLRQVESTPNLTPEQIKEIDDAVIKAANKALPYGNKPTKP